MADETLLKFPCAFPIKIVGGNTTDLEKLVSDTLVEHAPGFDPLTLSARESAGGKYLAVTATFTAQSKYQIDAIYTALSKHPLVKMVL